ncbi:crotonase/enoyl-CoA hydratase family protein [Desulfatitalea alkaliphila]|uniref:Crotonase/enoyl-CoA hydratase family protein n=1 Tax=Desulfatitalea alkaliphila TaxID=2929485 RepID=A0AA41R5M3_9BACT|nr:crotonase/enoyl-CoA hydratase family protein [Desulfatitalea alkaliphila]MCJ8501873.1 crotonase/enoyl-CoA hydratase family protein [Desulfatitalea alkaliphila]
MSELVKITIENHVADVRLNRPDKYNALNPAMFQAIIEAGQALAQDTRVRAVVLSGEGRGFCAGLDFQGFVEMGQSGGLSLMDNQPGQIANNAQLPGMVWKQVPVPVIAALHGVAFGGGLQIALGADIRLAAPDTRLSVMEIKWGIIPDMSATQTLRDLVRLDVAKELTFSGRIVEAVEAAQLGLITRISDDPLAEAHQMAELYAAKNPNAIAAAKRLFETAWHADAAEGLQLEASLQRSLMGTANQIEAATANFEKRAPRFADREG